MQFKYVSKSLLLSTQRPAGQKEGGGTEDEEEHRRCKAEENQSLHLVEMSCNQWFADKAFH